MGFWLIGATQFPLLTTPTSLHQMTRFSCQAFPWGVLLPIRPETLPLPHRPQYPPLVDSVPGKRAEGVVFVPCSKLHSMDDIVILMASDTSQSMDDAKDKLHHMVCSFFFLSLAFVF